MSDKKATGLDNIPTEIPKNLDEKSNQVRFEIIKECYKEGNILEDFIKNKTITIPKKVNAINRSNYRIIDILSHLSKLILSFIKNRLNKIVEERLDIDKFDFRTNKGTREAIIALRQLLERKVNVNRATFIAFIDLENDFDIAD